MKVSWYSASLLSTVALLGCEVNPTYHLGFPGPATVQVMEAATPFYGHDVAFTVYYPEDLRRPAPLIVFNTGWNQPRSTNDAYCRQLAQWGYVVINRHYPSLFLTTYVERHIEHNSVVVDWALEQSANPDSPLYRRINPDLIGAAGYSLGAGVALMAPIMDDRFSACVSLDPMPTRADDYGSTDYVKQLKVPTLFIASGVPTVFGTRLPLYEYTPPPCMKVTVEGASHMQFEDDIVGLNLLGLLIFPGQTADPLVTRELAVKYMVSWFKVYLEGDPSFLRYIDGPECARDVERGLVTIDRKLEG